MSSNHEIGPHVRQFIIEHLDSVMELELLLAAADRPGDDWSVGDMAGALRIADEAWVAARLHRMAARGLLAARGGGGDAPPRYAYAPATAELCRIVGEVARAYAERKVTVIGLIFSRPPTS